MISVKKCVIGAALASVLIFSSTGLSSTMHMPTPLMPGGASAGDDQSHSCPMSPLEHISWWNTIFSGIPHAATTGMILFLAFFVGTVIAIVAVCGVDIRVGLLKRQRFRSDLAPPLSFAFSNGILHSKLFSTL